MITGIKKKKEWYSNAWFNLKSVVLSIPTVWIFLEHHPGTLGNHDMTYFKKYLVNYVAVWSEEGHVSKHFLDDDV